MPRDLGGAGLGDRLLEFALRNPAGQQQFWLPFLRIRQQSRRCLCRAIYYINMSYGLPRQAV